MDRLEKVELLRAIMAELREPLPAIAHSIRKLPGTTDLYIYLSWERVRDRMDEVVPDYEISYTEPVFSLENNAITCLTTITILGVSKQAIASVPLTQLSKEGNNMLRGCPADRLHAEGIKNAAEAWGVGRYLEDQYSVYKSIWEARSQFPSDLRGKIEQMKAQFSKQARESGMVVPVAIPPKPIPKATTATTTVTPKTEGLYPQHNNIIKKLRSQFNASIDRILELTSGRYPSALNPSELQELELAIAIEWAVANKLFQNAEVAKSAARSALPQWLNQGCFYDEALLYWAEILQKPLTSK